MSGSKSELTRDKRTGVIHWRELVGDRLVIDSECDAEQDDPFEIPEDDIRDDGTDYENSV